MQGSQFTPVTAIHPLAPVAHLDWIPLGIDVKPGGAQSNPSPQLFFTNHAYVLKGTDIYDPSYGLSVVGKGNDRLLEYERRYIASVRFSAPLPRDPNKPNEPLKYVVKILPIDSNSPKLMEEYDWVQAFF